MYSFRFGSREFSIDWLRDFDRSNIEHNYDKVKRKRNNKNKHTQKKNNIAKSNMRADVFKLVFDVQWFSGMPATVKPNHE